MAISELQIALIGAGAAAVALVWGYNAWQDRQHRKTADRIFKGGQGDALLDGQQAAGADVPPADDARREPGERQEPHITDDALDLAETTGDASTAELAAADALPAEPAPAPQPLLPAEYADNVADCVLHLVAADSLPAPAVWAMQKAWAEELSKPLQWLAKNDADGAWQRVDANDTGRYSEWAVALQLVDRRGPVSDGELARFFDGVQQVATQTSAALELPPRGELVMRAGSLDEFCAGVDIQFVLHVVEASGGVFAGTKLRGVAEAAGLVLEADGVFRARDEAGGEMFTVANLGAERLDADSIKSLATHGLTLSLDVPRVADGEQALDRMLATARQLAAALGGVLVDAQRAPLADAMIEAIRARTAELQQRMRDGGIVPGSTRALRLFS
ncbi:MAG: cell division protein ZipA C-terminal FtsZ-binding domain-containing protein [Rhodocyclales bacterium]|nr:cell division protein ZipA C-terminal FtsZ-binding domain-containing protein [Rhodocyclales bacterium]